MFTGQSWFDLARPFANDALVLLRQGSAHFIQRSGLSHRTDPLGGTAPYGRSNIECVGAQRSQSLVLIQYCYPKLIYAGRVFIPR